MARYLGKSQFGLFAYVSTWVAILSGVAALGMDAIVVRRLIEEKSNAFKLIGTTIMFRAVASLIFGALVIFSVWALRQNNDNAWLLTIIMVAGVIFQSMESGELLFHATLEMRRLVIPRLALFLIINIVRVALIWRNASLTAFVALSSLEMAISGVVTFVILERNYRGSGRVSINMYLGWSLLRECWPLGVSGLVIILYMKISQLLLAGLLNDSALGLYASALRISEAPYFLPAIIASSILPSLLDNKKLSPVQHKASRMRYFRLSAMIGYLFFILFGVGSRNIIYSLYGREFLGAIPILIVLAGAVVFVFMGVARTQHLVNEGLTVLSLQFVVWGLLINVFLCLLLIPRFGPIGAAWAVVASQATATVFSSFIYPATRSIGWEQLNALLTPWKFLKNNTI